MTSPLSIWPSRFVDGHSVTQSALRGGFGNHDDCIATRFALVALGTFRACRSSRTGCAGVALFCGGARCSLGSGRSGHRYSHDRWRRRSCDDCSFTRAQCQRGYCCSDYDCISHLNFPRWVKKRARNSAPSIQVRDVLTSALVGAQSLHGRFEDVCALPRIHGNRTRLLLAAVRPWLTLARADRCADII
jgi:hypothetical protein